MTASPSPISGPLGARIRPVQLASFALPLGALLVGCGGGLPLLHPAQTLPLGDVSAAAGFSGQFGAGGLSSAVQRATSEAASSGSVPGAPGSDVTYARGALVLASVAPGLAPWGAARVGLGYHSEGGITYTGREVRVDARSALELSAHWALSIGAAGSAALYGHQAGEPLPNVDLGALHGWGADVPLLVGYRSDGDLYSVWLGVRGGWEHIDISQLRSVPGDASFGTPPIGLSATRFWGGGLLGVSVGFRHLHVSMEIDASYSNITGDYNDTHAQVAGVTIAPAAAVSWLF